MTIAKRDNVCLGSAGLAIGTTTSQISTTRAINYLVDGRVYNKAAVATAALAQVGTVVPLAVNQVCALFICVDAAGNLSTIQSPVANASTAAGYQAGAFEWPEPAAKAVIGAVLVKSGGAVFTPGTTALTGVATYIDAALDYGKAITY